MASDTTVVPSADGSAGEVMAAVDEDGGVERYVIADVERDEAWLAAPTADAAMLHEMR
ncbi:hypothetical protein MBEHAL_0004 [Halarchaeum acidiphilum MH1-52-1]|uniref:Uncharacterized protein n=1 Tax=Halarchaeum acidiphilum MH1-52-1 TaxID=1261545 RepID=U3A0S1_9EURY|nr:hypothetical protein [Halarchaeum acidiphilum]GAD51244.1 hypothetical protein MBEHAL_0004 [Halarchaeum acidiphilum MH1-52-1]